MKYFTIEIDCLEIHFLLNVFDLNIIWIQPNTTDFEVTFDNFPYHVRYYT